jgi:hypothetical protein
MRRSTGRPPQAAPLETTKTRATAAGPGRALGVALAVVTLTAALLLVWAAAAQAAVWVVPAMERAYPDTRPGGAQRVQLDAAGGEYQGVQVCARGDQRKVTLSWADGSDPLITGNARLFRVFYVHVTTPTTHLGSRPGWYPDPLVPREFGRGETVPGGGQPDGTTPFYVLVHVPYGTPGGDYSATLVVDDGGSQVAVPFSLHVWEFGWTRIHTHSGFAVSQDNLQRSLPRHFVYDGANKDKVLRNFYTLLRQHGISPTIVNYLPKVTDGGNLKDSRSWADRVAPYLDETADSVGLGDTQLPFLRWFPWSRREHPSWSAVQSYLTDITRVFKERGWDTKTYMYVLDETTKYAEERQAEKYARALHAADRATGAKVKFFLTDDPRPHSLGGTKTANTFLFDDVDIWTLRYYYFFGRIPAVRDRQKAGADIWWYSYTNDSVARTPSFVIDKPHVDSRAWGWLMERWDVDGLLNWGFNRWGKPATGNGWRDPYQNPLSLVKGATRSNGDTCLVYPGYYPRYGLDDPTLGAVGSLRLEALRDGLEEREYLMAAKAYPGGGGMVAKALRQIITREPPVKQANVFEFPVYTHRNETFDAQREKVAEFIEAHVPRQ